MRAAGLGEKGSRSWLTMERDGKNPSRESADKNTGRGAGGQAVLAAQLVQALTDPLDFPHRILYFGDDNLPSGCYTLQ